MKNYKHKIMKMLKNIEKLEKNFASFLPEKQKQQNLDPVFKFFKTSQPIYNFKKE